MTDRSRFSQGPTRLPSAVRVAAFCLLAGAASAAPPVVGFTEPVRRVDVAALEAGTLAKLLVDKGDRVTAGQTLGHLDDAVLTARLELARVSAAVTARRDAAVIRLERAKRTRGRLETLYSEGHGGAEEIDEADADVALAETDVRAAEEDAAVAALEVRRIEAELRRRRVRAPFDGVVADLLKQEGEFVSPSDPAVLTLVDVSRLRVSFFVPASSADGIAAGNGANVRTVHDGETVPATVEFASPLIDADSDTVRVDVLMNNESGRLRAGRRCELLLSNSPDPPVATRPTGGRR